MLKHLPIACAYALLALAVALVLPGVVPGVTPALGWMAGAVTLILGMLGHEAWARAEAQEMAAGQLYQLRGELGSARQELSRLRAETLRLEAAIATAAEGGESKARQDLDRVVSEVRVLGTLIEQLSARGAPAAATDGPPRPEAPLPVREGLDEGQILDIVREGLKRDRVDLYLQPIVSLPQRKVRFYECFSRIRSDDGGMVLPEQYIDVAKHQGLVGPIDNLLLFRCVQLVRRAQSQKHNVGFFCNISAYTLEDRTFFSDFVNFMADNAELARNLIFEFRQEDLESHAVEITEYISRLGRLGFYFSLDRVRDLARLDIPSLARRRFKFIKIDGSHLLRAGAEAEAEARTAAAAGGGTATIVGVNIAAFKRALDVHGVDLIAEKLESEQDLVELLDQNIDYGQGFLFGEPKLSREA